MVEGKIIVWGLFWVWILLILLLLGFFVVGSCFVVCLVLIGWLWVCFCFVGVFLLWFGSFFCCSVWGFFVCLFLRKKSNFSLFPNQHHTFCSTCQFRCCGERYFFRDPSRQTQDTSPALPGVATKPAQHINKRSKERSDTGKRPQTSTRQEWEARGEPNSLTSI